MLPEFTDTETGPERRGGSPGDAQQVGGRTRTGVQVVWLLLYTLYTLWASGGWATMVTGNFLESEFELDVRGWIRLELEGLQTLPFQFPSLSSLPQENLSEIPPRPVSLGKPHTLPEPVSSLIQRGKPHLLCRYY